MRVCWRTDSWYFITIYEKNSSWSFSPWVDFCFGCAWRNKYNMGFLDLQGVLFLEKCDGLSELEAYFLSKALSFFSLALVQKLPIQTAPLFYLLNSSFWLDFFIELWQIIYIEYQSKHSIKLPTQKWFTLWA